MSAGGIIGSGQVTTSWLTPHPLNANAVQYIHPPQRPVDRPVQKVTFAPQRVNQLRRVTGRVDPWSENRLELGTNYYAGGNDLVRGRMTRDHVQNTPSTAYAPSIDTDPEPIYHKEFRAPLYAPTRILRPVEDFVGLGKDLHLKLEHKGKNDDLSPANGIPQIFSPSSLQTWPGHKRGFNNETLGPAPHGISVPGAWPGPTPQKAPGKYGIDYDTRTSLGKRNMREGDLNNAGKKHKVGDHATHSHVGTKRFHEGGGPSKKRQNTTTRGVSKYDSSTKSSVGTKRKNSLTSVPVPKKFATGSKVVKHAKAHIPSSKDLPDLRRSKRK